MSRVQLALNVANLDESIVFYSKLFATEPATPKSTSSGWAVTTRIRSTPDGSSSGSVAPDGTGSAMG